MKIFIVSYNMPGYLPDSEPTEHDSFDDAKKTILWHLDNYFEMVEDSDEQTQHYEEIRNRIIETWNEEGAPYIIKLGSYVYKLTCDWREEPEKKRFVIDHERDGFLDSYSVRDTVEDKIIAYFSGYSDTAWEDARAFCEQLNSKEN